MGAVVILKRCELSLLAKVGKAWWRNLNNDMIKEISSMNNSAITDVLVSNNENYSIRHT